MCALNVCSTQQTTGRPTKSMRSTKTHRRISHIVPILSHDISSTLIDSPCVSRNTRAYAFILFHKHSPSTFLHFCRKLMFISLFVRVVCSVCSSSIYCFVFVSFWGLYRLFRLLILIFFFSRFLLKFSQLNILKCHESIDTKRITNKMPSHTIMHINFCRSFLVICTRT